MNPVNKFKEIVLFGTGEAAPRALQYFRKKGIRVKYYCDNDKRKIGRTFHGVNIFSPMNLKNEIDPVVVITSAFVQEIKKQLEEIGVKKIYYFPMLGYASYEKIEDVDDSLTINNNKGNISKLESILYDKLSVKVFRNIINNKISWNGEYLNEIGNAQDIYFPSDIMKLSTKESFVDAGAYTGDTIRVLLKKTRGRFNKIYGFEPSDNIFKKLQQWIKKYNNPNIKCFKKGLYDTNNRLRATLMGDTGDSAIKIDGKDWMDVVALDTFFGNKEPITLIKMDIEGAEKQAILGARTLIQTFKPKLSICLYHSCEDLWEIPFLIKSIMPEYKLFLRPHSQYLNHTICYASV